MALTSQVFSSSSEDPALLLGNRGKRREPSCWGSQSASNSSFAEAQTDQNSTVPLFFLSLLHAALYRTKDEVEDEAIAF